VERSRPCNCLTVFSGPQLPHRGITDVTLVSVALTIVSHAEERLFGEVVSDDLELRGAFGAVPEDREWVEDWINEGHGPVNLVCYWQSQRDSNPCRHLERVVSLASRRWDRAS
jgi:hypothetical protein